MCNLYAMMRSRAEVATAAEAMRDRNNNQPPSPGIFPDFPGPVVLRGEDGQREMRDMRWGLPTPPRHLENKARERRDKLIAKNKPFDWDELLKMEPDAGITNVRQTEIKHWQQWLTPQNRCLVPMTSFGEPDQVGKTSSSSGSHSKRAVPWHSSPASGRPMPAFARSRRAGRNSTPTDS